MMMRDGVTTPWVLYLFCTSFLPRSSWKEKEKRCSIFLFPLSPSFLSTALLSFESSSSLFFLSFLDDVRHRWSSSSSVSPFSFHLYTPDIGREKRASPSSSLSFCALFLVFLHCIRTDERMRWKRRRVKPYGALEKKERKEHTRLGDLCHRRHRSVERLHAKCGSFSLFSSSSWCFLPLFLIPVSSVE